MRGVGARWVCEPCPRNEATKGGDMSASEYDRRRERNGVGVGERTHGAPCPRTPFALPACLLLYDELTTVRLTYTDMNNLLSPV